MSTVHGGQGNIITNGLVLYVDAANPRSYPPPYNGTAWTDLSTTKLGVILTNGPTYNTGSRGNIVFDGTNDYADFSPHFFLTNNNPRTLIAWVKTTNTQTGSSVSVKNPIFGQIEDSSMSGIGVDNGYVSMVHYNYAANT